jgi:hypothetical protein
MKAITSLFVFNLLAFICSAQHIYPKYTYPDSIIVNAGYLTSQTKVLIQWKLKKINRFAEKESRSTQKLLKKLSKKEKKFLRHVAQKDTVQEIQLGKSLSFDSIRNLATHTEAQTGYTKVKSEFTKTVDSLKKLAAFANQKISQANTKLNQKDIQGINTNDIDGLENKLNANQYIQQQIQTRTKTLQGVGKSRKYTKGLGSISKQTFYYKQKLTAFKNIANDPTILEEKALEYLSGMEGFEKSMNTNPLPMNGNSQASIQQAKTVEDLEKMGYQTKRQVKTQMDKQFGMKTPEEINQVNTKFKEAKTQLTSYTNQAKSAKEQIKKLGFKPNPMRGLPLINRIEKSLNWQVQRATSLSPAIFEVNGLLGFKHTPTWTHSVVIGGSLGLGQNWQNIHFTFEGLRIGANSDAKLIWGISAQAGFERLYKKYQETKAIANESNTIQVITKTKNFSDLAYAGIQKTYKINSKYSGTLLLAYDFLWKQGNANSPIIWRAGWKK